MIKIPNQKKLIKLAEKLFTGYSSKQELLNEMHQIGVSRYECMVFELILLGKDLDRIQHVLLFTNSTYNNILLELEQTLTSYKSMVKTYRKQQERLNKLKGK